MRAGLIASLAGHSAILLWGLIAFPGTESFPEQEEQPVFIDMEFVTLADETEIQVGDREGAVEEPPAPKPREAEPAEEPQPAEQPAPAQDVASPPPPPPAPAPTPAPTPAAEPEPASAPPADAEPVPAPEPEPAAEPEPAPEPEPVQQAAPLPNQKIAAAVTRSKPTPPRRTPDTNQTNFDANAIDQLISKENGGASGPSSEQPASIGDQRGVQHAGLTANEKDLIRQMVQERWNKFPDQYPTDMRITYQIKFTPQGKLAGAPVLLNTYPDPRFQALADSAKRAIYQVDNEEGFTILPAEKYGGSNGWNELKLSFDPNFS